MRREADDSLDADVPPTATSSQIVRLNVGGYRFETTVSTLLREPDSMLGRMFSHDWAACRSSTETFIDRDGRHFHVVLNYLRDGVSVAMPEKTEDKKELL